MPVIDGIQHIKDIENAKELSISSADIVFENIDFKYDSKDNEDKPTLEKVNIKNSWKK